MEEGCGQDVTTICSFNETYNNLQIKREQGGVSKVLYVCLFFVFVISLMIDCFVLIAI